SGGGDITLRAGALFSMIGASPNTGWLSDLVDLDGHGFVKTGKAAGAHRPLETSRPGIFAIGDVRAGSVKRVASAAGEGSVVVPGIYEFLAESPTKLPDRMYDQAKKSALIQFARIVAGDTVIDVYPGDGDWTRLFSHAVGPEGRVYSFVPAEVPHFKNDTIGRMRLVV